MQAHDSLLGSKAFGELADSGLIVAYQSHQDALRFLSSALGESNGVALLQGPAGSGKTTIVKEQLALSCRDSSAAFIEGAELTPRWLLTQTLSQFGVHTVSEDDEQLLHKLNNFVTQETRFARPPVLFIDNVDRASPSALRLLNWLAALGSSGKHALRIVLTGEKGLLSLTRQDGMRNLARRHPAIYSLNPLTKSETMIYLRTRLIAAGGHLVDEVFPMDTCDRMHEWSSGWPGALNECAIEAMEGMQRSRATRPIPRIIVTCDGETVAEQELSKRQYVIGRTELADIRIEDSYVSKMHAMLLVYGNAIMLVDLNSTNGTTVNSRIGMKFVLRNGDIVTLGRHRLKIENAPAVSAEMDECIKETDTTTMASLEDLRRSRARRTVTVLKHQ